MIEVLFGIMYLCYTPTLCVEDHLRFTIEPAKISVGECTKNYTRNLVEYRHLLPLWSYCQYETDGPNYKIYYNLEAGTVLLVPRN